MKWASSMHTNPDVYQMISRKIRAESPAKTHRSQVYASYPSPALIDLLALLALAGVLFFQLLVPPVVALSNNGDFGKVLGVFALGSPVEDEYAYAPIHFRFAPTFYYRSGFISSEFLPASAALALSSFFSKSGMLDVRFAGVVHASLFVLAIYLLVPVLAQYFGPRMRAAIILAITVVLGDVMYASLLNSFYMDAAAYVFLVVATTLFLRAVFFGSRLDASLAIAGCAAFAGSKAQHAIMGVPLAVMLLSLRGALRSYALACAGAALVLAISIFTIVSAPRDYVQSAVYDVLFTGILPDSSAPSKDLAAFGLSSSYAAYVGTHAYSDNTGLKDPEFVAAFSSRGTYAALLRFFIGNPARTCRLLCRALGQAGRQRAGLGNFDRGVGYPPFFESQGFANWSRLKRVLFADRGSRYLWFTAGLLGLLVLQAIRSHERQFLSGGLCLSTIIISEMLVTGLGDAVEVVRHFTMFNALVDVTLLIVFITALPWRTVKRPSE